jgi:hypothetical protein
MKETLEGKKWKKFDIMLVLKHYKLLCDNIHNGDKYILPNPLPKIPDFGETGTF